MLKTEKQKYRRITPQGLLTCLLFFTISIPSLTACSDRTKGPTRDQAGSNPTTSLEIYNRFYNGTPTPSPYPTFGVQTKEPTETLKTSEEQQPTETLPTIPAVTATTEALPTIPAVTATVFEASETNTPVALIPDLQKLPSDLTPITELTPLNETRFTGCKEIINISETKWTDKDPLIQAIVTFVCTTQDGGQAKVTVWVPRGLNNPAVGWEVLGETRDDENHMITFKNGDGVEVKVKVYDFWHPNS